RNELTRRKMLQILQHAGIDLERVHVSTEQARPLALIERAMAEVRPELLVIGMSRWIALKRLLASSVADQVLRSVRCDVLAIPPSRSEKKAAEATSGMKPLDRRPSVRAATMVAAQREDL